MTLICTYLNTRQIQFPAVFSAPGPPRTTGSPWKCLASGSQKQADTRLKHFGSLDRLARASVEELLPFVSRTKALRLASSLWMGAVALREERQSLTIDNPLAVADLCSEMRFLDRESLRVVLLDAKQHLIKVATVSQCTVNEAPGHPREIFKPVYRPFGVLLYYGP